MPRGFVPTIPQGERPVDTRTNGSGGRGRPSVPPPGPGIGGTGDSPPPPPTVTPILPNPQPSAAPTFRTDTFIPITNQIPVYYGPFRAGGQLIFDYRLPSTGGKVCAWAICLGQISSITSITVEQRTLSGWGATFNVYLGDPAQTADPILNTIVAGWFGGVAYFAKFGAGIEPKTGVAIAYVVAMFPGPDAAHPDPDPYQFLVEGQGMLVVDPTLGISANTNLPTHAKVYSTNPYYIMADWMACSTGAYGCRQPQSSIDWSGTVTSSAAVADFNIGGGVKRFTMAAAINAGGDPWQEFENMRATCQGLQPVFNNGLWQFPIDAAQSASGIILTDQGTESNIVRGGVSPLVVAGPSQVKTRVRVTFTDTANSYKVDTTPADDDPGIALGTVPVEDQTFDIRYIPTYDQAVRIGKYLRKRSAQDKSFTLRTMPDGIQLLPGLRVAVTSSDLHLTAQDVLVTDIVNVPDTAGAFDVRFEYYDSSIYGDVAASVTAFANIAVGVARVEAVAVAASTIGAVGGRVLVGPLARIVLPVATGDTSIVVDVAVFANGDRIVLQGIPLGSTTQQTEYMAITSAASGSGPYTYNVTRNLDGSGADAWAFGDVVTGLGQTGSSFIDLYNSRGLKSSSEHGPSIVGNVRDSATYNAWTPRWAVGNLNGLYGYSTDIFGAAFGVPSGAWLKIDPTNGVRIGFNATTNVQIDASGAATFAGAITATSGTIGGWTIGATSLSATGSSSVIFVGTGAFNNTNTSFYVDGTGQFSLKDKLAWDGTNLALKSGNYNITNAAGTIKGSLTYLAGLDLVEVVGVGSSISLAATFVAVENVPLFCGFGVDAGLFKVSGIQVVGAQASAVANATNSSDVITQLNALLSRLRTHGLIAT